MTWLSAIVRLMVGLVILRVSCNDFLILYHSMLCLILEDHSNLTLSPQHEMPTHSLHSREKSKCVECHQKEITLQKQPGARAARMSKPAMTAGAVGCPIPLLAAGQLQNRSEEGWETLLHGEQVISKYLHPDTSCPGAYGGVRRVFAFCIIFTHAR